MIDTVFYRELGDGDILRCRIISKKYGKEHQDASYKHIARTLSIHWNPAEYKRTSGCHGEYVHCMHENGRFKEVEAAFMRRKAAVTHAKEVVTSPKIVVPIRTMENDDPGFR